MSNAIMNQVYNHYLTAYTPKGISSYDTHKKSELRDIYNSIIKMNKEAPLYLPDNTQETRQFAVDIKEQARMLGGTISSLGANHAALLNKRTAYSSNEEIATAKYLGSSDDTQDSADAPSFTLEVESLASPQVNVGTFLPDGHPPLAPGAYSFDVSINDMNYEFQFNIKEEETNLDIQKRLERLINSADIGLEASIIGDNNARSALRLASTATGLSEGKQANFVISDDNTSKADGTVSYFGLNYMAVEPRNAQFTLNGEPRSTASNHFTVEKIFEVTLTGVSELLQDSSTASNDSEERTSATIGLKTDLDSLADNVHTLVDGYNSFMQSIQAATDTLSRGQKLLGDMTGLSNVYRNSLDSMGLRTGEDGTLSVDDALLKQTVSDSNPEEAMQSIQDFAASLLRKTGQISLNPMQYVDKTIVAYKNPGKTLATPYVTSPYSGMLFSSYC